MVTATPAVYESDTLTSIKFSTLDYGPTVPVDHAANAIQTAAFVRQPVFLMPVRCFVWR